jgi:hypothetical protein
LNSKHSSNDIDNVDETDNFCKLLPHRIFFKEEKCPLGKRAKDRLTTAVCTNMTGTDKSATASHWKIKESTLLQKCESLSVNYKANSKAWVTG